MPGIGEGRENPMDPKSEFEAQLCDQGKALLAHFTLVVEQVKGKGFRGTMEITKAVKPWEEHRGGCSQCKAAFEQEKAKERK